MADSGERATLQVVEQALASGDSFAEAVREVMRSCDVSIAEGKQLCLDALAASGSPVQLDVPALLEALDEFLDEVG